MVLKMKLKRLLKKQLIKIKGDYVQQGDLVKFNPKPFPGALTAIKYFERIRKRIAGNHGIVISKHGDNYKVMFGSNIVILNEDYLEVISG